MIFEFKRNERQYANGYFLLVNGYALGEIYWDGISGGGWIITTKLPCFSPKNSKYEDLEKAKTELQEFTKRWFKRFEERK